MSAVQTIVDAGKAKVAAYCNISPAHLEAVRKLVGWRIVEEYRDYNDRELFEALMDGSLPIKEYTTDQINEFLFDIYYEEVEYEEVEDLVQTLVEEVQDALADFGGA